MTRLRPIRRRWGVGVRAQQRGDAGHRAWGRPRISRLCLLGISLLGLGGCKDLTPSQPLPAGTINPTNYNTPAGAAGLRFQALYNLQQALPRHVVVTGLLTDELQSKNIGASTGVLLTQGLGIAEGPDARLLSEESYSGRGTAPLELVDRDYGALQQVRADLSLALGAIAVYDTGAKTVGNPKALRAELFALQGYTELLLADFYCSGVPLSTLDFQRDYTYHASSTTAQVYQDAIAKEDSALALADTSIQLQYLARVLKGRALLALDNGDGAQVAAAAQVVASIPDGFQYRLAVYFPDTLSTGALNGRNQLNDYATIADQEGQNGLPYLSSRDPRTADTVTQVTDRLHGFFVPLTFPSKYSTSDFSPFVVASGLEARLIQAEAALHAGNTSSWLTTLNQLRTTGTYSGITPPDTIPADTIVDTLGVTDCTRDVNNRRTCGSGGGSDPAQGQPVGFPPAGYSVVGADTTYPAPAGIQAYCFQNSEYEPCGGHTGGPPGPGDPATGDTMVVFVYVRPQHITPGDTLWNAGTGGVNGLGPLQDPGAALSGGARDSARVALQFRERAFWLFLTGERQGDLRRLLRQYPQWFPSQDRVYPTGRYTAPGTTVYGTAVTAPIPGTEYLNPLYHGCLDRKP